MRALTISQPFASLIANGKKFVENRSWPTDYRGPLAIHAGKGTQYMSLKHMRDDELPIGAVVAIAELEACVTLGEIHYADGSSRRKQRVPGSNLFWSEVARHEHTEGPWCWILGNVRKLKEPLPMRGAQGLWDVEIPEGTG